MNYLLSESKKQKLNTLISSHVIDLTEGRRRCRQGAFARPSGGRYSGYFSISDSSDDEAVKVAVAYGRCRVNSADFEVQETEVEITGNGYVYLETAMNDTGEFVPPAVKFSEDYPVNEDGKFKALLGVVNIANEKITEIKQAQYGFNYGIICGECL